MKLVLCLLFTVAAQAWGYHILGIFPVPSRSHNILGKGIVDSLLKAGHQVTWVTPYPVNNTNKNLKVIHVETTALNEGIDMTNPIYAKRGMGFVKEFARNISTMTANTPALREAVVNTQFDAVVTEWFFSESDAGYAAIQQRPWILLAGMVYNTYFEVMVDEIRSAATVPSMMFNAPLPMNFWQRMYNTGTTILFAMMQLLDQNSISEAYNSYFTPLAAARGVHLPPFAEAVNDLSIMFVNSHSSFMPAQVTPPNVIPIAGYHISEDVPPLPKDLQDLMDSSSNGVVYFSMGSVMKSASLPERTRRELIQVLGELPYTVLWKFEEAISGLPKNVHVRPWMPQQSILQHPKLKLFITHGGLLSNLESLQYGVPLLAIPMFGDQPGNADRAVNNGYARKVTFGEDLAQNLRIELKEMLGTDRYYKRAKHLSQLFRNRPVPPSKLVSYYVELAIKSNGAHHLRSVSKLYPWYARWMLDQVAFLLVTLYILVKLIKKSLTLCFRKDKKKIKKN
ncbi:UDP-glucosyltransferase 2-like [Aphomia sociella]